MTKKKVRKKPVEDKEPANEDLSFEKEFTQNVKHSLALAQKARKRKNPLTSQEVEAIVCECR